MGFFDTFGFDEYKYRRDHEHQSTSNLEKKLKEKKGQIARRAFGVGAGIGAAAFTGGVSLVGTAYSARQISVIDQQCDILKDILRRRGQLDDSDSEQEGEEEEGGEEFDAEEYKASLEGLSRNQLLELMLPLLEERYCLEEALEEAEKSREKERLEQKVQNVFSKFQLIGEHYEEDPDVLPNPDSKSDKPHLCVLDKKKFRKKVENMSQQTIEETLSELVEEERVLTEGLEPFPRITEEIESDLAVIRQKRIILYVANKQRKDEATKAKTKPTPPPLPARQISLNEKQTSPVNRQKQAETWNPPDEPLSSETFDDADDGYPNEKSKGQLPADDPYYWSSEILD
ncbi:hypothetical protein FRC17_006337 [Serendipita sp. 399]|nr:hypothetical protein FRC17_006337 [Serendipita sp. 399]